MSLEDVRIEGTHTGRNRGFTSACKRTLAYRFVLTRARREPPDPRCEAGSTFLRREFPYSPERPCSVEATVVSSCPP